MLELQPGGTSTPVPTFVSPGPQRTYTIPPEAASQRWGPGDKFEGKSEEGSHIHSFEERVVHRVVEGSPATDVNGQNGSVEVL